MTLVESLRARGLLSAESAAALEPIESRRLFSVHDELRAMLYCGALLTLAGVGATVAGHFHELGPLAIAGALTLGVAACFGYCFSSCRPYSPSRVEPPTAVFDYVLYLGCGLLGIDFQYLETQFELLREHWRHYLMGSGLWLVYLAYRFDNRFALTAGLLNIFAWLELSMQAWSLPLASWRVRLLLYGAALFETGRRSEHAGVKPHFEELYATLGFHCASIALLPEFFHDGGFSPFTPASVALSCAGAAYGWRRRRFAFIAYAVGYAYFAVVIACRHLLDSATAVAWFFLITAPALIAGLLAARRRLQQGAS